MRKTITGIRYDTETAIFVGGHATSPDKTDDLCFWQADLYVAPRSGRTFLIGRGGFMTMFNSKHGDWAIHPISREQAKAWASLYLDRERVERFFSDVT